MSNQLFLLKYKLVGEENELAKLILQVDNDRNNILEHEFEVHKDDINFTKLVNVDDLYKIIYEVKKSDYKTFIITETNFDYVRERFYIKTNLESKEDIEAMLYRLRRVPSFHKSFNKADFLTYLDEIQKEVEHIKSTEGIELYKRKSFTKRYERRKVDGIR